MRFAASAVAMVALAAETSSFAFAPKSSAKSGVELNMRSHYNYDKPSFHPDYKTNMNNIVLDEYSGLTDEEAEQLEEDFRLTEEVMAEELRQEEEAMAMAQYEAEEAAMQKAAKERAMIKEADDMELKAVEDAKAAARAANKEKLASLKAEQEKLNEEVEAAEAAEDQEEMTEDEQLAYEMKSNISSEDAKKMVGLTGWRRMQFMDNTLDGTIIKRFPQKPPGHPDSRTNNKHFDMDAYYDVSMEEHKAYREEARLEARRRMGHGKQAREALEAAKADARLAAEKRGKVLRETMWRVNSEESNNRIMMKKM